jgi:RimJ/RimL family protein N-acetyltransferase
MLNTMTSFVQTKRLALRRFTLEDADLLIELDSDPAVMRYLTGGAPTVPGDVIHERVLPSVVASYAKWKGKFGLFAAYENDGGAFIGWFQLRPQPGDPEEVVELGYRLRRQAWGKGYATEGARALLDKAFRELEVRVVWGETMAVNVASQNVMDKVGMTITESLATPEDMQLVEGSDQGGFRYEITKEQYLAG